MGFCYFTLTVFPRISAPALIVFVGQIYPQFFSKFQKIIFRWVLMILSDSRDTVVAKINLITRQLSTNVF